MPIVFHNNRYYYYNVAIDTIITKTIIANYIYIILLYTYNKILENVI